MIQVSLHRNSGYNQIGEVVILTPVTDTDEARTALAELLGEARSFELVNEFGDWLVDLPAGAFAQLQAAGELELTTDTHNLFAEWAY